MGSSESKSENDTIESNMNSIQNSLQEIEYWDKFNGHHSQCNHTTLCTNDINVPCPYPRKYIQEEKQLRLEMILNSTDEFMTSVKSILFDYIEDENDHSKFI